MYIQIKCSMKFLINIFPNISGAINILLKYYRQEDIIHSIFKHKQNILLQKVTHINTAKLVHSHIEANIKQFSTHKSILFLDFLPGK